MDLVDREPNFYRSRLTRCAACGHEQSFCDDWFERWSYAEEVCPGCGVDCTQEKATRVVVDPADPALIDSDVVGLSWWHTSTHPDWPAKDFDPSVRLDEQTKLRMGGDVGVARWVARQRAIALHVGTYEAAIHNMFRRLRDQHTAGEQFHLYRVRLRRDVVVAEGCGLEPVDWMGDVALNTTCPGNIDVARYLNEHEDPGSISLALGRTAIASVQRISLPTAAMVAPVWHAAAVDRLQAASAEPVEVDQPHDALSHMLRRLHGPTFTSEREQVRGEILTEVTEHLPNNIRESLRSAILSTVSPDPEAWCDILAANIQLIDHPDVVIRAARHAPVRTVEGDSEGPWRPCRTGGTPEAITDT